jgi:hypothetical protein
VTYEGFGAAGPQGFVVQVIPDPGPKHHQGEAWRAAGSDPMATTSHSTGITGVFLQGQRSGACISAGVAKLLALLFIKKPVPTHAQVVPLLWELRPATPSGE